MPLLVFALASAAVTAAPNPPPSAPHSTTMGYGTKATEQYSTAMGLFTTASGSASTAMGASTTASGQASTAMGDFTTASGRFSSAMGEHTTAATITEVVLGRCNVIGDTETLDWVETDAVLRVGVGPAGADGSPCATREDALRVLKSGKVFLPKSFGTAKDVATALTELTTANAALTSANKDLASKVTALESDLESATTALEGANTDLASKVADISSQLADLKTHLASALSSPPPAALSPSPSPSPPPLLRSSPPPSSPPPPSGFGRTPTRPPPPAPSSPPRPKPTSLQVVTEKAYCRNSLAFTQTKSLPACVAYVQNNDKCGNDFSFGTSAGVGWCNCVPPGQVCAPQAWGGYSTYRIG